MKAYLFLFMMFVPTCLAQTRYYNESKEIQGTDYTYHCDVKNGVLVTLTNTDIVFRGQTQVYTASNEEAVEGTIPYLHNDGIGHKHLSVVCRDILKSYLTTEVDRYHTPLELGLYINPQTGRITDVTLSFAAIGKCGEIPPDTYRKIELGLKSDVCFEVTAEGKKVNFIYRQTMYYQR